jgi:hypothetical protein
MSRRDQSACWRTAQKKRSLGYQSRVFGVDDKINVEQGKEGDGRDGEM